MSDLSLDVVNPAEPRWPATHAAPEVLPSREDAFVRGMSEAVGGPLGEHATTRTRSAGRWLVPARVVLMLALAVFALHWVQKSPCMTGDWSNNRQYTNFCYTDVFALYYAEGLNQGQVPYYGHPVEYPVLTGYLMGAIGLPVHSIGAQNSNFNQGEAFYSLTALVLTAFGVACVVVLVAMRRRRPWDGAMLALAPAMVVTATVNWDLLAVGLTVFFLYAWARRWQVAAGVFLGLAVAAKFYPVFLAGPLIVLALRTGKWRPTLITLGSGAVAWIAVNAPIFFGARSGWDRFWVLSTTRGIDWGTLWYVGAHQTLLPPMPAFSGMDIPTLNIWTYALFGLGCLGLAALTLASRRRPRLAQLCFIVIAVFLLTSKVWSQQYVLWLIPLAVLARPRWGAFLIWQVAELLYFLAFYAQMLNMSGHFVIPEGTFDLAAALRWVTVAMMVGLVVYDILRPSRDVVRQAYEDDPDGGVFDGAPDGPLPFARPAPALAGASG
jgi:uncharacterized membrane protein